MTTTTISKSDLGYDATTEDAERFAALIAQEWATEHNDTLTVRIIESGDGQHATEVNDAQERAWERFCAGETATNERSDTITTETRKPFRIIHRNELPDGDDLPGSMEFLTHHLIGTQSDPNLTETIAVAASQSQVEQAIAGCEGIVSVEPSTAGVYADDTEGGVTVTARGEWFYA